MPIARRASRFWGAHAAMHAKTMQYYKITCEMRVRRANGHRQTSLALLPACRDWHTLPTSRRRHLFFLAFCSIVLHSQATTVIRERGKRRANTSACAMASSWRSVRPSVHAMQMAKVTGSHLAFALWRRVRKLARAGNGRQQSRGGGAAASRARARSATPIIAQLVCSHLHTAQGPIAPNLSVFLFFPLEINRCPLDACLFRARRQLRPRCRRDALADTRAGAPGETNTCNDTKHGLEAMASGPCVCVCAY